MNSHQNFRRLLEGIESRPPHARMLILAYHPRGPSAGPTEANRHELRFESNGRDD